MTGRYFVTMTRKPNTQKSIHFSFLKNEMWSRSCQDGYDTVTKLELWSWLDQFKPTSSKLSSHPNLELISKNLDVDSHSGASWVCIREI